MSKFIIFLNIILFFKYKNLNKIFGNFISFKVFLLTLTNFFFVFYNFCVYILTFLQFK